MKMKKTNSKNKRPASRLRKTVKRGIQVRGSWKAVALDPSMFSEEGVGDMGGLVCFEELTDYRLVDPVKTAVKAAEELEKKKKKKAKKRKTSEEQGGDEPVDQCGAVENTPETSNKPVKKKKKSEVKISKQVSSSTDGEDKGEEVVEEDYRGKEVIPELKDTAPSSEMDAESQSNVTKNEEKRKNRHKKGQTAETGPGAQPEDESQINLKVQAEKQPCQDKKANLPKKKPKNWTNAALSGSDDKNTDVSAWKGLFVPASVLEALSSLGFGSPTPIQALVLPPAIRDHLDIVGAAETGSGKTLSFGIPMIHSILEWKKGSEGQDDADDQDKAHTKVESLYLPNPSESAVDNDGEQVQCTESNADLMTAQDGEHKVPAEGEGEGITEHDIVDEDIVIEEENQHERIGCVKVIENVDFDFNTSVEAVQRTTDSQNQPLLGLVLTPTRELAVQVKHHIDAVAKFTDIKTALVVGGMALQKQTRMLKRRPEVIIATPGRLWELIKERHPHLLNLRYLRCLVIDEADRMVERGHFAELECLLEMLNTVHFNPKRQTFVFSATLTMAHSLPMRLLQKKKKNLDQRSKLEMLMEKVGIKSKPKIIDLTRKEATVATLTETRIHCEKEEKDFFLYYFLLQYPGRTMVFANSIECIKRLNALLVILDWTPLPLHANMHQKQRLKNLERFAEREKCVLLTTDVAARGLDIPDVQHVIHYQVPRTSETYVHRSGRTARATKEGLSLLLIGPDDMVNFKKIYRALGKDEDLAMFPIQNKCMAAIKERVNLARKIEKIEFHHSREQQHDSWFKQAAEALEMDLDDDVLFGKQKNEEDHRQQQKLVKGMKKHLKHLLSQPVFKNVIKTKYPTQMGTLSLPQIPLAGFETALTSVSTQKKKQKKAQQQQ
ncbi:ATP-dependent RNA helicase DDX24 [Lampris incognitus]|uniref:ATP-dependent RNA helicase DDX24 n=1 Tax=Lampris incognitus TaxID=2546036 RepID=UPI0024B575CE|nr:ATP-dependent RNA helicase DDX24 [Lampris incognitus]